MTVLTAVDKEIDLISDEIWLQLEDICNFLKPFAIVTKAMSGSNYPTLSGVIPYFNSLCDHVDIAIKNYGAQNDLYSKVYIILEIILVLSKFQKLFE